MRQVLREKAHSGTVAGAKKWARRYLLATAHRTGVEVDETQIAFVTFKSANGDGFDTTATAPILETD